MRVDRKVWGPGPLPGSRIVLAYPGDEVSDEMWDRIEAAEITDTNPEPEEAVPEETVQPKPAAKKAGRRRKKTGT